MILLKTVNELIALDLGMMSIDARIAQVKASEDRQKIEELEARVASLAAIAGEAERAKTPDAAPAIDA